MAHCLVIDDSADIRGILHHLLDGRGHRVAEASGPGAAADAVAEREPEIVFLDWDLPGFGALEVLRAAAGWSFDPTIVLVMSIYDERQLTLARAAGAAHHLMKPFDGKGLDAVLHKIGVRSVLDRLTAQSA